MNDNWKTSSYTSTNGACVEASGPWRTSSRSSETAYCVEVSGPWRTSHHSEISGLCVEVATTPGAVKVRDTKDRDRGIMAVSDTAWGAFLTFAVES